MKILRIILVISPLVFIFQGCVRLTGSAGYWKTTPDGEVQSKQAGFDTANLVSKDKTTGNITI